MPTDETVTESLYGNYRAKVVNNKDKNKYGRVYVWIPDLMPDIPHSLGLWARPANNPAGGRNQAEGTDDNYFAGSSYIPKNGSWIWVFFEAGNINRPYYFGALDLENTTVLAENTVGTNYEDKWTIYKSHNGRTIIISDDPDDERVEITGKKRLIASPPSGDAWSVYAIDRNQTTILLDERSGKEKILIRTYKGDFIHIDVDDQDLEIQFANDIHIKCGGNFYLSSGGDMHFLSGGSIHTTAKNEINTVSGHRMNIESGEEYNRMVMSNSVENIGGTKITLVAEDYFLKTEGTQQIIAGDDINTDANTDINDNSGLSVEPPEVQIETIPATPATPEGERDT